MANVFEAINSPLGSTMGQGVTWTPQQYLSYLEMLANSPQGQAAQRAQQQTAEFQIKQALDQLKLQRDQLAITRGQAEADRWYKQEQLKLAQQAHQLAVQQQQWTQQYQTAGLTGELNGAPTLANLAQQASFLGTYNGQPTLQAQNQQQQFGLQQGALTGQYQGAPTLAAIGQQQNYGLNLAGVTGYMNGAPTLANQQFLTGASGYLPTGEATLQRQQAAANTALQAGQLAASLQGPGDWAAYLQAANAVNGSDASALLQGQPGGLGATQAYQTAQPRNLGAVLGQMGMMPQLQPRVQPNATYGQMVMPGSPAQQNEGAADPYNGTDPYGTAARLGISPADWAEASRQQVGINDPGFNQNAAQQRLAQFTGQSPASPSGRSTDTVSGGVAPQAQGYDPLGALARAANAGRPTNAQLGVSDQEADVLKQWFGSPNLAPTGWLESKSPDQRAYLGGLAKQWGFSPDTINSNYRNSRPRQQSSMAA